MDRKSSRVSRISPDGKVAGDIDLPIDATGLAYDAATDRFTVVNGDKVVKSNVPTQIASAPAESAPPSAQVATTATSAPSTSASASPSANPSASPSASPSVSPATPSASPSQQPPVVARSTNALQQASSV